MVTPSTDRAENPIPSYVIVIPAYNEEAFIGKTLTSLMAQTHLPLRVVIVDDASTDGTLQVVEPFLKHDFVRLITVKRNPGRHFGNKVEAFNRGYKQLDGLEYDFIGNLDSDISFEPDYFARLIARFEGRPTLGLAGGQVHSWQGKEFVSQEVSPDSVSGAVQLFRRACFEELGGYIPLPLGGVDTAAEIGARLKGWEVRTFSDIVVKEHRKTGWAAGSLLKARIREGQRMHSIGYDPLFFCVRCVRRALEPPMILGSLMALWGYLGRHLRREPHLLSQESVAFLRAEQRAKLRALFTGKKVIQPPADKPEPPSSSSSSSSSSSCAE